MKQVLFVGAGQRYPQGPAAFLRMMQQEEKVHARALFFKPIDIASLTAVAEQTGSRSVVELEKNEEETIASHKALFARECEQNYITYSIHEQQETWDKDLLVKESRFADLILISEEHFFANASGSQPNDYLRETLHAAECPVILVPETFTTIEHVFMAYDGSRDSCHAIKQFCYLFPGLIDLPVEILYVNDGPSHTIPDLDNLKQFTRLKFECMSFSKLPFKASDYFATWIGEKRNALLVSGSFGRSPLSYIAKRSFAEDIIGDHTLPVFIAHH